MSCKSIINDNTLTKKCGEITITIKKNSKNVYSFNCWFCDTIYVQMKKFTLHLEREHVNQLEEAKTITAGLCNEIDCDDKFNMHKETTIDNMFVGEIKIEDCDNEDIKSEIGEDDTHIVTRQRKKEGQSLKFEDPLETFTSNTNDIAELTPQEKALKIDPKELFKNESTLNDMETENNSDDDSDNDSDYNAEDTSSDIDIKSENNVDDQLIKPFGIDKTAKEKQLIVALIDAYYQKPQLWNTAIGKIYQSKKKDELLKNIADELNKKLNLKLKLFTVKTKLGVICKQYENEIKRQLSESDNENEKSNEESDSKLWYYENLSFLKPIIENKIKNKRTKSYHKVKPLSDKLLCEIIEIYKTYNGLWDVNDIAYMVTKKRKDNLQLLLEDITKKLDISLNVDKLEKHLQYIHNSISSDKQLKLDCESKEQNFEPTSSFFNKCDFLEANLGPFKCPYCSKICMVYKDFQIHKTEHDDSFGFICQKCGKGFKTTGPYILHVKRHLGVLRFTCNICGKGYPLNSELNLHMRSHTGDQPFLCSLCGERFRSANCYDNHIRRHEQRFRYSCHICKRGFNTLSFLNNHVKAHLNIRDVICTTCGKGFTSKKLLSYHQLIHESKKYKCDICGKSYAQSAGLRQHKRTHGTPIGVIGKQKEIQ